MEHFKTLRSVILLSSFSLLLFFGIVSFTSAVTVNILDDATGGDCTTIGSWLAATKTCTLTSSTTTPISIGADNIILDGGNYTLSSGSSSTGINISSHASTTIKNITISGVFIGILVSSSASTTIDHVTVTSSGTGLKIESSSGNIIKSNTISNSSSGGVSLFVSTYNTFYNNTIQSNSGYGVGLYSHSDHGYFSGNSFSDNDHSIDIDSDYTTIVKNNFTVIRTGGYIFNYSASTVLSFGLPTGGNFWENFSVGCADTDSNGVCDSAHVIDNTVTNAGNTYRSKTDSYPWAGVSGWSSYVNKLPVITLLGSNPTNLLLGDTFTDSLATSTDYEDGNLTSSIVVTGTVNTTLAETYTKVYTVTDTAGGVASTTRSVIVSDNTNPVTALTNPTATSTFSTNSIYISGTTTDAGGVASTTLAYATYTSAGDSCGAYTNITTLNNSSHSATFDFTYTWSIPSQGTYCLVSVGRDLSGNLATSSAVKSITYSVPVITPVVTNSGGGGGGGGGSNGPIVGSMSIQPAPTAVSTPAVSQSVVISQPVVIASSNQNTSQLTRTVLASPVKKTLAINNIKTKTKTAAPKTAVTLEDLPAQNTEVANVVAAGGNNFLVNWAWLIFIFLLIIVNVIYYGRPRKKKFSYQKPELLSHKTSY